MKIRVLLLAPKGLPTVTLSFIKPLSLIHEHIEYQLIHTTGNDTFDGETTKEATTRRCLNIINSFQPDILIMCRYFDIDALSLSSLCKKNGIKVIYHIDDLLFDPSPEVLDEAKYNAYRKRAPIIIDLIKKSDLIYCSTPALSKEISSYIHHPNISMAKYTNQLTLVQSYTREIAKRLLATLVLAILRILSQLKR